MVIAGANCRWKVGCPHDGVCALDCRSTCHFRIFRTRVAFLISCLQAGSESGANLQQHEFKGAELF